MSFIKSNMPSFQSARYVVRWACSIAVRALAYCAEDHGSGPTSSQWLDTRSLSTQQRMGTWWKHW